ncbi:MAG: hypothetical protein HRU80_05275 [Ignavibacteriales bacterium]|nr:MAG: hypothetical protein HRU80_05275 [Ignavibacteriales bacterium]
MKNKSLIFIGAGATAQIMGATEELNRIIYSLFSSKTEDFYENSFEDDHNKGFNTLLKLLDPAKMDSEIERKASEYASIYDLNPEELKFSLRGLSSIYDYECLSHLVSITANQTEKKVDLMLLYSTIDLLIKDQGGLQAEAKFFDLTRIRKARSLLNVVIHTILMCQTANAIKSPQKTIPYLSFVNELVEYTRLESIELGKKHSGDFTDPDFVNFGYSVVSFNWEPLILGMIFKAHKDFNHSGMTPYLGNNCLRLRLFNDFGLTIGSLRKDNKNDVGKVWYQGHESIAIRVNDSEYPSRLMRVGKFLFPHGSLAFRMCPVCRKTNFVVRGIDNLLNYFGPGILPEFNDFYSQGLLTEAESKSFKRGHFDALECYCCKNIMRMVDTPLIMQTAFKDKYPPILEESLYELTVQLIKANHLLFIGYKCSEDDVVYRSKILAAIANSKDKKVSVVLFDRALQDQNWFEREELKQKLESPLVNSETKKLIQNFLDLFQSEDIKIRISFKGFPQVVTEGSSPQRGLKQLLEY